MKFKGCPRAVFHYYLRLGCPEIAVIFLWIKVWEFSEIIVVSFVFMQMTLSTFALPWSCWEWRAKLNFQALGISVGNLLHCYSANAWRDTSASHEMLLFCYLVDNAYLL